jgi:hypothetical protein
MPILRITGSSRTGVNYCEVAGVRNYDSNLPKQSVPTTRCGPCLNYGYAYSFSFIIDWTLLSINIKPKYQLREKELEVFRTIGFLSDKVHTVY